MKLLPTLGLAPLLLLPATAEVTVFHGPAAGPGDVRIHDELGIQPVVAPAGLQGIRLLAIDAVGRSPMDRLKPNRLELVTSRAGVSHLRLPRGHGALYRFRRDAPGGAAFGLFRVDGSGRAALVFELPGTGPTGSDDPLLLPLAVAPRGNALLLATTVAAGGDLLEVDLSSGTVHDHTAGLAPQSLVAGGLALTEVLGGALTTTGLLRFDRGAGSLASQVSFPTATPWFEGSLVASADGSTLALVAGASAASSNVWAVRAQGPATCVTAVPGAHSGAGHLPGTAAGPTLALSPDGSMCMFRTEGPARDAWMAPTTSAVPTPAFGMTSDPLYTDTLDTPAEFLFLNATTALLLVGEADPLDPTGVENADLYRFRMQASSGPTLVSVSNVTMTSGDARVPFLSPGELDREAGIYLLPGGRQVLAHLDGSSGQGEVLLADLRGGVTTVLPDVKSLDGVAWSAGTLALDVRRSPAFGTRELWTLRPGAAPGLQLRLPDAYDLEGLRHDGAGTFAAFLTQAPAPLGWVVRTAPGGAQLFWPAPLVYGGGLEFAPSGQLAASVDVAAQQSLVALWSPSGALSLLTASGPAFVLASE